MRLVAISGSGVDLRDVNCSSTGVGARGSPAQQRFKHHLQKLYSEEAGILSPRVFRRPVSVHQYEHILERPLNLPSLFRLSMN